MSQLLARGGIRLTGEVTVQGAKNSVLPILAATLLTGGQVELRSCPHLRDVEVSIRVLETLGCHARWEGDSLMVDTAGMNGCAVPDTLTREMRSSALFLGAILARLGRAELSYPGGWDVLWDHRFFQGKFVKNGRTWQKMPYFYLKRYTLSAILCKVRFSV